MAAQAKATLRGVKPLAMATTHTLCSTKPTQWYMQHSRVRLDSATPAVMLIHTRRQWMLSDAARLAENL